MALEVLKIGDGYSIRSNQGELVYIEDGKPTAEVIAEVLRHCMYSAGFAAGKIYNRQQQIDRMISVQEDRY